MKPSRLYKHPRRFPLSRKARPVLPQIKLEPAKAEQYLKTQLPVRKSAYLGSSARLIEFKANDVNTLLEFLGSGIRVQGVPYGVVDLTKESIDTAVKNAGYTITKSVIEETAGETVFKLIATKAASPARVLPVKLGKKNREFLMSHNICLPL